MRRGWAAAESRALRVKPRDDVAAMTQTVQAVPEVLQIRPPGLADVEPNAGEFKVIWECAGSAAVLLLAVYQHGGAEAARESELASEIAQHAWDCPGGVRSTRSNVPPRWPPHWLVLPNSVNLARRGIRRPFAFGCHSRVESQAGGLVLQVQVGLRVAFCRRGGLRGFGCACILCVLGP